MNNETSAVAGEPSGRYSLPRLRTTMLVLCMLVATASIGAFADNAYAQSFGNAFSGLRGNSNKPIQVESDQLEVLDKQSVAIFTGNVNVVQGATVLKAQKMKVYYTGSTAGEGGIKRMEITGKVYVKSEGNVATGDRANVDMAREIVTLTGNVVLSQAGGNVARGKKLTVNMRTGRSTLSGRPTMLLQPRSRKKK